MLAKEACRIMQAPESLFARVLKAGYFKAGDFMVATCTNGGSYTWRSILHGRDLLKLEIIWRIGNGSQVKIADRNWIPRKGCLKLLGLRKPPGA